MYANNPTFGTLPPKQERRSIPQLLQDVLKKNAQVMAKMAQNAKYIQNVRSNLMEAELRNTMFAQTAEGYQVKPNALNQFTPQGFMDDSIRTFTDLLLRELPKRKNIKFWNSYTGRFERNLLGEEGYEQIAQKPFISKSQIIRHVTAIDPSLRSAMADLAEKINNFEQNGSGWIFKKNIELSINIRTYKPIAGGTYIETPREIVLKKCCVNIAVGKNKRKNDYLCYKWCIVANFHLPEDNAGRAAQYEKYFGEFNWQGIDMPTPIDQIERFERQNPNVAVNVYMYEYIDDKVVPNCVYATINHKLPMDRWVNLLMLVDNDQPEKYHYILIKPDKLTCFFRDNRSSHTQAWCPSCQHCYSSKDLLDKHLALGCTLYKQKTELPKEDDAKGYYRFQSIEKMLPGHTQFELDFECLLPASESDNHNSYQSHEPCSYAYSIQSIMPEAAKDIELHRGTADQPKVVKHLIDSLLAEVDRIEAIVREREALFKDPARMIITNQQKKTHERATTCFVCGGRYIHADNYKVRDHCHLTGQYRGAAHYKCNLNYNYQNRHYPVIIHNAKNYDTHLIIKAFTDGKRRIWCYPTSSEKFIAFGIGKLTFIDSATFINASLENAAYALADYPRDMFDHYRTNDLSADEKAKVVATIKRKFKNTVRYFSDVDDETLLLLAQKGEYPYDYMDDWSKFEQTTIPTIDQFYNRLLKKPLDPVDYGRIQEVWRRMNIQNMGEYHDLYLKLDVLLLSDIWTAKREQLLKEWRVDPNHYVTFPSCSIDALLLKTRAHVDVFSDKQENMHLLIEKHIKGGICGIMHRHAVANNPYITTEEYDPHLPTSYIPYFDCNGNYAWAMSQYLPYANYDWDEPAKFDADMIMKMTPDQPRGYIFEVDLTYPKELHDTDNCLPMCPEHVVVTDDMLSPYCRYLQEVTGHKMVEIHKLIPNLNDKKEYLCHYRCLQFWLGRGMKLTKVHRVIAFDQAPWMKSFIEMNVDLRIKATSEFEKVTWKFGNNAPYGKTLENKRNRPNFELVNDEVRYQKLINDPKYVSDIWYNSNLAGVSRRPTKVKLDKPIIVGYCITELSKWLMYDFHYNVIKKEYGEKAKLCGIDTDGLEYWIQTEDLYADLQKYKDRFDFSGYGKHEKTAKFFDPTNKGVMGKFKDETKGFPVKRYVGLRSKMKSYKIDGLPDLKKAAGVKKNILENDVVHDDYERCWRAESKRDASQEIDYNDIRSFDHELHSIKVNKIGLCAFDNKRWICDDRSTTLAIRQGRMVIIRFPPLPDRQ